jgi:hypothetical protein
MCVTLTNSELADASGAQVARLVSASLNLKA